MMANPKENSDYLAVMRIVYIFVFMFLAALLKFLVYDEGYQEHYLWEARNKDFGFTDYLGWYPTELWMPCLVLVAIPGFFLKKPFGWIAGVALMLTFGYQLLKNQLYSYAVSNFLLWAPVVGAFWFVLFQLRREFRIRPVHYAWLAGLLLAGWGLILIENSGGFIGSKQF